MGLMLPVELRRVLDFVGLTWPATDESVLWRWANDLQSLSEQCADLTETIDDGWRFLAGANEGPGITAASQYVRAEDSAVSRLRGLNQGLSVLAEAYRAISVGLLMLKLRIILILVRLAQTLKMAVRAGGWGILIAAAVGLATKVAIDQIMNVTVGLLLG